MTISTADNPMPGQVIEFDTYEEWKGFAYSRGYEMYTSFGDIQTWFTEGIKAIVYLDKRFKNFVNNAPVRIRLFKGPEIKPVHYVPGNAAHRHS